MSKCEVSGLIWTALALRLAAKPALTRISRMGVSALVGTFAIGSLAIKPAGFAGTQSNAPRPAVSHQAGEAGLLSLEWIPFPDARVEVHGLPWFKDNSPQLWRLPNSAKDSVPTAVWNRALAPCGGRLRFTCDTSRLALRVQVITPRAKPCYFDAYLNGNWAGLAQARGTEPINLLLFDKAGPATKHITVYLPHTHPVRVLAVGVAPGTRWKSSPPFVRPKPLVCYGSSVLQGTGAAHPARTYPAVLARTLNLDFVNLGFGGAGKAETNVVALVNQVDACGFLFDLGKSYGAQPATPYALMLDTIRRGHPNAPIFCVTPIYSLKEATEPDYRVRSETLRTLMRQAAADRIKAGDKQMFVVEGLELFGESDKDAFNDPLHPNDEGNDRMAARLAPLVRRALLSEARLP